MKSIRIFGLFAPALILGALSLPAFGQAEPGNNPPAGDRPRFDPAQFRQRMLDRLKQEMGSTDEEFQALQPKIEKVLQAQREVMQGRFGGRRGPGGPGGPDGSAASEAPQTPVQMAAADLRKILDNKDAKPEEIKAKMDALRDARAKAKNELTAAQQDLRGLLTQRQEAVLVMSGLLE